MGFWSKIRLFRSLPSGERALLVRAAWMLFAVDVGLRIRGWRRCRDAWSRWADRHSEAAVPGQSSPPPLRVAWLVERAARTIPWPATCLRRSLVLWTLLRRMGVSSELRLGMRKESGRFEAHAWVEWNGRVLNDRQDIASRYESVAGALER